MPVQRLRAAVAEDGTGQRRAVGLSRPLLWPCCNRPNRSTFAASIDKHSMSTKCKHTPCTHIPLSAGASAGTRAPDDRPPGTWPSVWPPPPSQCCGHRPVAEGERQDRDRNEYLRSGVHDEDRLLTESVRAAVAPLTPFIRLAVDHMMDMLSVPRYKMRRHDMQM